MDPTTVISTSIAANAVAIGAPYATEKFKAEYNSAIKVNVPLTLRQQTEVNRWIDFTVSYVAKSKNYCDHRVLDALREITRHMYSHMSGMPHTKLETLVVGATAREVKMYNFNHNVNYYFHSSEVKDSARMLEPILEEVCGMLYQQAAFKNKMIMTTNYAKNKSSALRYFNVKQMLDDYRTLNKMPGNFHFSLPKAARLLFEDSFYNIGTRQYLEIFKQTSAVVGYGYGLLPFEMTHKEMPRNNLYNYLEKGNKSYLSFRFGVSDGYVHETKKWRTLFDNPLMRHDDYDFMLHSEFVQRVGPYVIFKISKIPMRCSSVYRSIELPDCYKYVRILDFWRSVDLSTGKINKPLHYISVFANEYYETLIYWLSLNKTARTIPVLYTFIRRRKDGISLVTSELVPSWQLPTHQISTLVLAVFVQASIIEEKKDLILDNVDFSASAKIKRAFLGMSNIMMNMTGLWIIRDLLQMENLVGEVVKFPDPAIEQYVEQKIHKGKRLNDAEKHYDDDVVLDMPDPIQISLNNKQDENNKTVCDICNRLHGKLGEQILICKAKDPRVQIELTTEYLIKLKNDWETTDTSTDVGKAVKAAAEHVPEVGFKMEINLQYMTGGPGNGKSMILRLLATTFDCVLLPFRKLRKDYIQLVDAITHELYNLYVKTPHRGVRDFKFGNALFVDEGPCTPFEMIAIICHNANIRDVYLFGDEKQTHIIEPNEGIYIFGETTGIKVENLSTHILGKNFRSKAQTVALLNKKHGYSMVSHNKEYDRPAYEVLTIEEYNARNINNSVAMGFSELSCKQNGFQDSTVRQNQGGSEDYFTLYVTKDDASLIQVESLRIVAISRHKEMCYIVHDNSETANTFLEFYDRFELQGDEEEWANPIIESNPMDKKDSAEVTEVLMRNQHNDSLCEYAIDYKYEKPETLPELMDVIVDSAAFKTISSITQKALGFDNSKLSHHVQNDSVLSKDDDVDDVSASSEGDTDSNVSSDTSSITSYDGDSDYSGGGDSATLDNGDHDVDKDSPSSPSSDVANSDSNDTVVGSGNSWSIKSCQVHHDCDEFTKGILCVDDACPCGAKKRSTHKCVKTSINKTRFQTPKYNTCLLDAVSHATKISVDKVWDALQYSLPTDTVKFISENSPQLSALHLLYICEYLKITIGVIDISGQWGEYPNIFGRNLKPDYYICWQPGHWSFNRGVHYFVNKGYADKAQNRLTSLRGAYKGHVDAMYFDHVTQHITPIVTNHEGELVDKINDVLPESFENCGTDDYLFGDLMYPESALLSTHGVDAFNAYTSQVVHNRFRNGKTSTELLSPINPRGNVKQFKNSYYTYGTGRGYHYSKLSPMQTLEVIGARYCNKEFKAMVFDQNALSTANKIADEYFDEHMHQYNVSDDEIDILFNEYEKSAESKHYRSQYKGFDDPDARSIRFHLKQIFKPKSFGSFDLYKFGQGISAWSKCAHMYFAAAFRVINYLYGKSLNENALYDNRMTEEEFLSKINGMNEKMPKLADVGVTDVEAYDSLQNKFTQSIVKRILSRMGISRSFIEHYYSFRNDYKIVSPYSVHKARSEKTSGEPGTLILNTILASCLTNYLLRGEGPALIVGKGDDGYKSQLNLKLNNERLQEIMKFCKLKLKLSINGLVEFCGRVIKDGVFYDSLFRKLTKIMGHRFRDYKHFCEYQTSLRDFLNRNRNTRRNKLIAVNAHIYGTSYQTAHFCFSMLESFAHINEKQFLEKFMKSDEVFGHLGNNGFVTY